MLVAEGVSEICFKAMHRLKIFGCIIEGKNIPKIKINNSYDSAKKTLIVREEKILLVYKKTQESTVNVML